MKIYLQNPDNGAPIKKFYDGQNYWKLDVGEVAAFPEGVAFMLKRTYGFLREVSLEEFELQLDKLEKTQVAKVKVDSSGQLVPKKEEEVKEEEEKLEVQKKEIKKNKEKVVKAKEAQPDKLSYEEMPRGALIAEINKRNIKIQGFGRGRVSKEHLIQLLENDDNK